MENNGNRKTKRGLLWAILIVALCGIGFAVYSLISSGAESAENKASTELLREQVVSEPAATASQQALQQEQPAISPTEAPKPWWSRYAKPADKEIDFGALRAINTDVCAWITVPGTAVDYPIVYTPKIEGWYLEHNFEGNSSKHGAIFMDDYNVMDFSDPVTVVYGHNMKDGSMFAGLHDFEDARFFDKNDCIRIYTPEYMLEYEIVAARKATDENIMAKYDISDDATYAAFQESIFDVRDMTANFREAELTTEDRLIVLLTCVRGDDDARYLVYGRLKENE